jgi:hypothetical protein
MRKIGALGVGIAVLLLSACSDQAATPKEPVERHLVYAQGEDLAHSTIWIADENGAHQNRLGPGEVGILSPDGLTVAIGGKDGIELVSADGKTRNRLTGEQLRPQAWSPDSKQLFATESTSAAVVKLVALDRSTSKEQEIASGSLYGFDLSPDGKKIVYSRAPRATTEGICGDQFDLYVADLDGGDAKQLTNDGLSAFPVWGDPGIAFSRFPSGVTLDDCSAPGVWTIDPDGSNTKPVIATAPGEVTAAGFYGLQPIDWLDDQHILVGMRSEFGTRGAVLDRKTAALRQYEDYADKASSDGKSFVGSGGGEGVDLTITRVADGKHLLKRRNACCPDWNR